MDFIERNDQFSGESDAFADDQGNRITYGEFEKIYGGTIEISGGGKACVPVLQEYRRSSSLLQELRLRNHVVPLLLEHRMDREL